MNAPDITKAIVLTGNPAIDGLILKGLVAAAVYLVSQLATHLHVTDPNFITFLVWTVAITLITVATFVYGWVLSKVSQAKAVQAGINLTVSGNALAQDGKTVVSRNDGTTPPLPVTTQTAPEIVKNFAIPVKA